METVYLSLGSNLGNRLENLRRALGLLAGRLTPLACSAVYETAPVDCPAGSPGFLNLAAGFACPLDPPRLLEFTQRIEAELGRRRPAGVRNAPRPIDIDILLYGERSVATAELTIPHPRMQERLFVLAPLREIAPQLPCFANLARLERTQEARRCAPAPSAIPENL